VTRSNCITRRTQTSASEVPSVLFAIACVVLSSQALAQTPLKPPQNSHLQAPTEKNATPATSPTAPSSLSPPKAGATSTSLGSSPRQANAATLIRLKTLKANGKLVDLSTMRDTDVLKSSSGRTISVARIKQLEAKLNGASSSAMPMMVAKPGQSLKTLATAPVGTRVQLPSGKIVQSQDLGKIQNIYAKLSVNRSITPIPRQVTNAQPQAVVGQGITLAEAMKRPANDVIQIGSHKYTAEKLRQIDGLLKASPRDPRGLLERAGSSPTAGRAGTTPIIPNGPRLKMQRGTSVNEMLTKPDNTVLESPSGKIITVAQLKQYMAIQRLTPAQLQGKATGRVVEIK
jgi:hypothetical protein